MSDDDIHNQENVSARGQSRQARQQVRHRASVACSSCRDRRIRCVVPKGETACNQCKRAGTACVIKNDDERRRPISKAYMSSLSERIQVLEGMLLSQGVVPPPAVHPPKTRQEGMQRSGEQDEREEKEEKDSLDQERMASPPDFWGSLSTQELPGTASEETSPESDHGLPERLSGPGAKDLVQQLLAHGNLSFDQLSGWRRCLPEQTRPSKMIDALAPATLDYLMDCFWTYYNTTICVVDRAAFEADRETQSPRFYSSFLHIAMLAMGFRFADHSRVDMHKIGLGRGGRESSLQREAKYMVDRELECPGGISTVQALLLLGDLECGAGRENTGWMYASMANRLVMDLGLHLEARSVELPETTVRLTVMKAVLVLDKYWALYLGRPPSIKREDLRVDLLSGRLSGVMGMSPGQEMFEHLFELMELGGKIVAGVEQREPETGYLHVISLDRQLQNWYRRLPDHLAWKPANIKTAPIHFFLLHQQYHACMVLLHRPWAHYGSVLPRSSPSPEQQPPSRAPDDNRTALSRSICTQQAVRVARIFWLHRQRFDGRRLPATSMQHAGTAAMALIAALACPQANAFSSSDRLSFLSYLDILAAAIADMSHTYQPAVRMSELLRLAQQQLRADHPTLSGVLPADLASAFITKKPCRRASEFARPPRPGTTAVSQPLTTDYFGLDLFGTPMDLEEFDSGPPRFCPSHAALSPVSLGGLDKVGETGDRNHELDFFRL